MSFRTKGTVHIVISASKFEVKISPAHSHIVTVRKDEYILFLKEPVTGSPEAKLFPKAEEFGVDDKNDLKPALLNAAATAICIEIEINDSNRKITGLVLPARDR